MMSDSVARQTEEFLYSKIPMVRAMGARVAHYDETEFIVEAPLSLNHNHLGTAFGGSLAALATVAGYGMLWLELGDQSAHVVIRESAIQYLHPVRSDLRATCRRPEKEAVARFREGFSRKGKARLRVEVTIHESGTLAVAFSGTFVALR